MLRLSLFLAFMWCSVAAFHSLGYPISPSGSNGVNRTVIVIKNGRKIRINCAVCRLCCYGRNPSIQILPGPEPPQTPGTPGFPSPAPQTPGTLGFPAPAPQISATPGFPAPAPQIPATPDFPARVSNLPSYPIAPGQYATPPPITTPPPCATVPPTTTTQAPTTTTTTTPAPCTYSPPTTTTPTPTVPSTTGYATSPPSSYVTPPTSGYPTVVDSYRIPETTPSIVPIDTTTLPQGPQGPLNDECCSIDLRSLQATVSCGIRNLGGRGCCQSCTSVAPILHRQIKINAQFFSRIFQRYPSLQIPCSDAVFMKLVEASEIQGACDRSIPFPGLPPFPNVPGGESTTETPGVPIPDGSEIAIPTGPPGSDSYPTQPKGSSAQFSVIASFFTIVLATVLCL